MTIWKFPVKIDDMVTVEMPSGAEILCVQMQGSAPCVWAKLWPKNEPVKRVFRWRGTGHDANGVGNYVGTVQIYDGRLVFHLFVDSEQP